MNLWLPQIPYTLIDNINRAAAATGSLAYAGLTGSADYNGHYVHVQFNQYRGYWVAEYWWAGRHVLGRGDFRSVIEAAAEEYRRGAKGTVVLVHDVRGEEADYARTLGFVEHTTKIEDAHYRSFTDARNLEINHAFRLERQCGIPAVGFLANSATVEEYKRRIEEFEADRRVRLRTPLTSR